MGRFYTANRELSKYLLGLGLEFHDRECEDFKYYTQHETGNQVKLDLKDNLVTLLDAKGGVVDYSSSYTDSQINTFLKVN